MTHPRDHLRPKATTANARQRGFTLVELVTVLIIIGVLAAIAVPKFISMGRDARLVAVSTLAAALRTTAENVHALCSANPVCDLNLDAQTVQIGGRSSNINYGWPDAGDDLGADQIDVWVTYAGFTASIPAHSNTLFTLDGSPDPANCSVTYYDAYYRGQAAGISIVSATAGC